MERPPRNLKEHIITPGILLRSLAFLGLIQAASGTNFQLLFLITSDGWILF